MEQEKIDFYKGLAIYILPEYRIEAPQNEWEITKKEVSLLVLSK